MNLRFSSNRLQLSSVAKLFTIVIGILLLSSVNGLAIQDHDDDDDDVSPCREKADTNMSTVAWDEPIVVQMEDLTKEPELFYGKVVTVDGELHREFTDSIFTIEDGGWLHDKDILVISTAPRDQVVRGLSPDDEIKRGKDVRVTGLVQPFDRARLECAYGPLNLEHHEGASFTKNPVLIIDRKEKQTAAVEPPPAPTPEPEPTPEPLPPVAVYIPAPMPEPMPEAVIIEELPRTAGGTPLFALGGLVALAGALVEYWRTSLRKG